MAGKPKGQEQASGGLFSAAGLLHGCGPCRSLAEPVLPATRNGASRKPCRRKEAEEGLRVHHCIHLPPNRWPLLDPSSGG